MTEIELSSEIIVDPISVFGNDQNIIGAMKTLRIIPPPEKTDEGRIRYLMQNRHGTPFEHNSIILFVDAPIFVWREWHRHRIGFSYNEESARYSTLRPKFFIPHRNRPMVKVSDEKWKPSRPKFITLDENAQQMMNAGKIGSDRTAKEWADLDYKAIVDDMRQGYAEEYPRYERQLQRNLDPGLARDNLPVGIFSRCWVTCNLRSALSFLSLRTFDPNAKFVSYPLFEIHDAAVKLELEIAKNFPIAYTAFNDFGRVAP